jgi:SAM-dependent methyltransferase
MSFLHTLLAHPLTRGCDLDDPETTLLRRSILQDKKFLRKIYQKWYTLAEAHLPNMTGPVLELGGGAGFANEVIPELLCSDIMTVHSNDLACDACHLPLKDEVLRAIVMFNVLHHITDTLQFLKESYRCVRPGGRLFMLEPWVTPWSSMIYSRFHHEPFDPAWKKWSLPKSGPLSGGNDALPWILFERDWERVEEIIPWRLVSVWPLMPFSYLLSGGIAMRSFLPGWMYGPVTAVEALLPEKLLHRTAMFAVILLEKDDI